MKKQISLETVAKTLNDLTFVDYYNRLQLLARSVFEWDGLPNGIDEKWIEDYLFNFGRCVFFKDVTTGFMVAKASDAGKLNFYDEPTRIKPYGTNYNGKILENNIEAVVIRNNDAMIPTATTIQLYAYRLAEIARTIDINVHAQKTPILIPCTEKQRLSVKNAYAQWDGNTPVMFTDKTLDINEGLKVLKTDAPIVFDKLQLQKHAVWNECMTFLGINNANQDKRERLVDDEVQANNEQIELSAQVMLKARERACEQINELFDLNVSVRLRNKNERLVLNDDKSAVYNGSENING